MRALFAQTASYTFSIVHNPAYTVQLHKQKTREKCNNKNIRIFSYAGVPHTFKLLTILGQAYVRRRQSSRRVQNTFQMITGHRYGLMVINLHVQIKHYIFVFCIHFPSPLFLSSIKPSRALRLRDVQSVKIVSNSKT